MTNESISLDQISAYVAENKRKSALEAEKLQNMVVEAKIKNQEKATGPNKIFRNPEVRLYI